MVAVMKSIRWIVVAAAIFCSVTLQAQSPTPDDSSNHQVTIDSGQETIVNGGVATTADELDAIRLEIIELRRFVLILGGAFLAWNSMKLLFRYH